MLAILRANIYPHKIPEKPRFIRSDISTKFPLRNSEDTPDEELFGSRICNQMPNLSKESLRREVTTCEWHFPRLCDQSTGFCTLIRSISFRSLSGRILPTQSPPMRSCDRTQGQIPTPTGIHPPESEPRSLPAKVPQRVFCKQQRFYFHQPQRHPKVLSSAPRTRQVKHP